MNKSSRISRWQLGTIGVVCCIVGIRILLGIGNRVPVQEDVKTLQTQPPTEELQTDFPPKGGQSAR